MTPDVNILIAAPRADRPHHKVALAWLTDTLTAIAGGMSFKLLPFVAASFLRLVTNKKIFPVPMSTQEAIGFIDAIPAVPSTELIPLGSKWPHLRQLCLDESFTANDIPDAWLAVTVVSRDEHLVTFDAGFKKLLKRSQLTLLSR